MTPWAVLAAGLSIPADATMVRGIVINTETESTTAGIFTTYELAIEDVLFGEVTHETARVRLPGGVANGQRQAVFHVPVWEAGDDVVATICRPKPCLFGNFLVVDEMLLPAQEGWPTHLRALEDLVVTAQPGAPRIR
jgi:hypothetical protein